jgi:hypothetical protein
MVFIFPDSGINHRTKLRPAALPILSAVMMTLVAVILPASCSASKTALSDAPIPYIPPSYYECTAITSTDLLGYYYYYNRYAPAPNVEQDVNNHLFVLKNLLVTDSALKYATSKYIWMDGIVQCYFLAQGTADTLRAGDRVDVVGVNAGVGKDYAGTLIFTGCIFLPAGRVQLPAAEGAGPPGAKPY